MYRQSEKNLLNSNIYSTCPDNMVNFNPLAAEIGSGVWGTAENFNGFHVLAALLHGTLVVGVSQTLRRWTHEQRTPPIFGRAAITLGIGPHSSVILCILHRFAYCIGPKSYLLYMNIALALKALDTSQLLSGRLDFKSKHCFICRHYEGCS